MELHCPQSRFPKFRSCSLLFAKWNIFLLFILLWSARFFISSTILSLSNSLFSCVSLQASFYYVAYSYPLRLQLLVFNSTDQISGSCVVDMFYSFHISSQFSRTVSSMTSYGPILLFVKLQIELIILAQLFRKVPRAFNFSKLSLKSFLQISNVQSISPAESS